MESLPIDRGGIPVMAPKGEFFIFKTSKISSPAANIIKQQMLSIGGECAVSKFVATCSVKESPVILMGTQRHFLKLIESLKNQYFGLGELREELMEFFEDKKKNRFLKLVTGFSIFQEKHLLWAYLMLLLILFQMAVSIPM